MHDNKNSDEVPEQQEQSAFCQEKPADRLTDAAGYPEKVDGQAMAVIEQLQELKRLFDDKIKKDTSQKQAFDKLYEEMRQYKDDFIFAAVRPILADLILLYDNMVRAEHHWEDARGRQIIGDLREELLEILYRQDVEPVCISDNTTLDRRQQRVIQTVATDIAAEDKQIVRVVREGFMRGDRVLRPQEVVCKKLAQQKEQSHE